jgi:prepilin peptidase CpaA
MHAPFFPAPVFGWMYLVVLLSFLAVASYTDLGRMVVPKTVSLSALAMGIAFNLVRGVWLGAEGLEVWKLGQHGPVVGALDGFLFTLAGFALGFALFFLMWIVGACGGGDVKLFAALGAWVGPYLAVCVLGMTLVVVTFAILGRVAWSLVRGDFKASNKSRPRPAAAAAGKGGLQPRRRVLGFSLPLAIATALVLLWAFRVDLQFVAGPGMAVQRTGSYAEYPGEPGT